MSEEVFKQKQEYADRKDWNTPKFWGALIPNVLLVIIGIIYSLAAWKQLSAIKLQGRIAQRTLAISDRPWINVEGWRFSAPPSIDTPIIVKFYVRNFGKSPAWISKLFVRLATIDSGENFPEPPDYSPNPVDGINNDAKGRLIAPGEAIEFTCLMRGRKMFDSTEYARWRDGSFYIFAYGFIDYEDSWGKIRPMRFSAQHGFIKADIGLKELGIDVKIDVWNPNVGEGSYHFHDREKIEN